MVQVSYGINSATLDLAGKTVGEIRTQLSSLLNIPAKATAHVDGEEVNNGFVVSNDEEVEFIKVASEKGI